MRIWDCHSNTKSRDASSLRHKLGSGTQPLYKASNSLLPPTPLSIYFIPSYWTKLPLSSSANGRKSTTSSTLSQTSWVQHSSVPAWAAIAPTSQCRLGARHQLIQRSQGWSHQRCHIKCGYLMYSTSQSREVKCSQHMPLATQGALAWGHYLPGARRYHFLCTKAPSVQSMVKRVSPPEEKKGLAWSAGISESWAECLYRRVAQHGVGWLKKEIHLR